MPAPDHAERRARAVALVERFWNETWNRPHDLTVIDELMVDDFVITTAGEDIVGRAAFRAWVAGFQRVAADVELAADETFANHDGTRVTSRWTAQANNRGMLGTEADGRRVSFTGIAIWEIRWIDGEPRLAHNWVERSAWELYRALTST